MRVLLSGPGPDRCPRCGPARPWRACPRRTPRPRSAPPRSPPAPAQPRAGRLHREPGYCVVYDNYVQQRRKPLQQRLNFWLIIPSVANCSVSRLVAAGARLSAVRWQPTCEVAKFSAIVLCAAGWVDFSSSEVSWGVPSTQAGSSRWLYSALISSSYPGRGRAGCWAGWGAPGCAPSPCRRCPPAGSPPGPVCNKETQM